MILLPGGLEMSEEFKARLIKHARDVVARAGRAQTEAATQQYLILPFLQVLGYDPLNPDEVIPEAHASFSDKFKNRVDYAICIGGDPVIAIECKCAGKLNDSNRGELKGYFNAVPSVKLGILTDGLTYQLFSDTARENMMDDDPFVSVYLAEVAKDRITDNALDAFAKLRKGTFDPADVGADAKRKIYIGSYIAVLEENTRSPAESFVRTMADLAQVEGRRTSRLLEEHEVLVTEAFEAFLDKKILERVGFAERQDLVKMQNTATAVAASPADDAAGVTVDEPGDEIITTEAELKVFDYVRTRLSFLCKDERMFREVANIGQTDRKTVFIVYYRQERKGRLFNFREGSDPKYHFEFPDLSTTIETDDLREIDEPLLEMFSRRVAEFG
jgi:hypothetical protein